MIAGIFIQVLFLALIIFGIYRIFSRGGKRGTGEFSIRRLFQYSLLYLSVVVVGLGASGLLARVFTSGEIIAENRTDLARNLSFLIVGIPLLFFFARWSWRIQQRDVTEQKSISWNSYLTITTTTSLISALVGFHDLLSWLIGNENFRGAALVQAIVWTLIWIVHWQISKRDGESDAMNANLLLGSGVGLVLLAVGFGGLIGNSLELLMDYKDELTVIERTNPIVNSGINVLLGLPVWYLYWIRNAISVSRDLLWNVYVLLAGIAASFITMVVSASIVIYDLLVWFLGDTNNASFARHFYDTTTAIGSGLISLGVWTYHRLILASRDSAERSKRSELRRVYEYLISGISLIAASLGILMIIVAAIESVTPGDIATGEAGSNALLLAITLLIVGAPIWWFHWNRIETRSALDQHEKSSPTRRIFILMLFGVSGVAAIISIITAVFLFFDDLLNGELAMETLRSARYAIGILVTNAAIAGYHWSIYRIEKDLPMQRIGRARKIILVGPADSLLLPSLRPEFKGEIDLLVAKDGSGSWNVKELLDLIQSNDAQELLIINEKRGLKAIEIED